MASAFCGNGEVRKEGMNIKSVADEKKIEGSGEEFVWKKGEWEFFCTLCASWLTIFKFSFVRREKARGSLVSSDTIFFFWLIEEQIIVGRSSWNVNEKRGVLGAKLRHWTDLSVTILLSRILNLVWSGESNEKCATKNPFKIVKKFPQNFLVWAKENRSVHLGRGVENFNGKPRFRCQKQPLKIPNPKPSASFSVARFSPWKSVFCLYLDKYES